MAPLVMAQLMHEDLEHVGEARVPKIVAKAFKGPKVTPWTWSGHLRFGLATACQSHAGEVAVRDLQLRLAALKPADHLPGKVGRANGVKEPVVRCAWKDPFTDAQLLDEAHALKLHGVHEKLHLGRSQAQPEANPLPPNKNSKRQIRLSRLEYAR